MKILELNVKQNVITKVKNEFLTSGGYKSIKCKFDFSSEWEEYTKTAVFVYNGVSYHDEIINNECYIPAEAIETDGTLSIGVFGSIVNEDNIESRLTTKLEEVRIYKGSFSEGEEPINPTPSAWETYLETVKELIAETTEKVKNLQAENIKFSDGENLQTKFDNGDLGGGVGNNGATFTPNVSENGDLSWTNDKGLENPSTVNIKGDKGDVGPQGLQGVQGIQGVAGSNGKDGKDFSISKTYASIALMEADKDNVSEGDFVMIVSTVEDEDNSKLFVKGTIDFVFITDLSGATGMKGDTGPQGPQGEQGLQGVQGIQGLKGEGVPTGGEEGQVLAKNSNADYDTKWVDQTSGSSSEKEVGYADEELEGTEKILIEESDFEGVVADEVVTMETITNDNGTAIKFSDGTMICKYILDLGTLTYGTEYGYSYIEKNYKWSFPISFISIDDLVINLTTNLGGGIGGVTVENSELTVDGCKFYPYSVKQDSLATKIYCIAIGKWK